MRENKDRNKKKKNLKKNFQKDLNFWWKFTK